MASKELLDFIETQLKLGLKENYISKQLVSAGWTQENINEGFKTIYSANGFADEIKKQTKNRIKFYITIIGITFISINFLVPILIGIIFGYAPLLILPAFFLVIILIFLISIIYEIKHPINIYFNKIQLKKVYWILSLISMVVLITTIFQVFDYLKPVIVNYNNLQALSLISSPYKSNTYSIYYILTNTGIILKYALLVISISGLILSLKKKEISRIFIVTAIFIFLISNSIYNTRSHSIYEDVNNIIKADEAIKANSPDLCRSIKEETFYSYCMSEIAPNLKIEFNDCSVMLKNIKEIASCRFKAIKEMPLAKYDLCFNIDNNGLSHGTQEIINQCFYYFALKDNNFTACSFINASGTRLLYDCYKEIQTKSPNLKECNNNNSCIQAYVEITGDSTACSSHDTICFRNAAIFHKDKRLCLQGDSICSNLLK